MAFFKLFSCTLTVVALLAACSPPAPGPAPGPVCAAGQGVPMQVVTLFFGRAIPGRPDLTEAEWQDFRDRVITPALQDGYTEWDGHGAWMNPATHATIQEATRLLVVALPDTPASRAAIDRVRSAYQTRFHQQLVGRIVQAGCATF
jgi:hypothetical protein